MRKLAWFVIVVLVIIAALGWACWYSPWFSSALYNFGVNIVGLTVVNAITGAMTGMMLWGSTGLGPATAVFFGVGIGFTVLWLVLLRKYVWNPIKGAANPVTTAVIMRGGPEPELPQTIEQVKPSEVKKEEA